MSRADQIAEAADAAVDTWFGLGGLPGTVHKLKSGGYLVDVGDAFPVWRADMSAVRRLLLALAIS